VEEIGQPAMSLMSFLLVPSPAAVIHRSRVSVVVVCWDVLDVGGCSRHGEGMRFRH